MNTDTINQYDITQPDKETREPAGPSIGKRLMQARAGKGISLREASEATKLKTGYLEALENDNYDLLPAVIYAKNFIRIYANYLGLDGNAISDEYGQSVTVRIELPEKSKTAKAYYIAYMLNFIIKHKYMTLLVLLFLVIFIAVYSGSSSRKKQEAYEENLNTIDASDTDAYASVSAYVPVTDMKEPLPEYE